MKTTKEAILEALKSGRFAEASWVTGKHYADADYAVGYYVTSNSYGDWTDHPSYSGVHCEERGDETVENWVLSHLPNMETTEVNLYNDE